MIITLGPSGTVNRRRRGITIIEVMVVMTGVAAMLGLCAITIQLLLRVNAEGQSRVGSAATLERLTRQFREDAHACDGAQVGEKAGAPGAGLRLTVGPKRQVAYEASDGRVVRVESESGKSTGHESYSLGRGAAARFELRDDAGRRFVALVVTGPTDTGRAEPPRPLEVVALQGKDRIGPLKTPGDKR